MIPLEVVVISPGVSMSIIWSSRLRDALPSRGPNCEELGEDDRWKDRVENDVDADGEVAMIGLIKREISLNKEYVLQAGRILLQVSAK